MPYAAEGQISRKPVPGGIEITEQQYSAALAGMLAGDHVQLRGGELYIGPLPEPEPEPDPPAEMLLRRLLILVDSAADAARHAVAGDPLRAVEYDRARIQAEEFAAAGFQGEAPAMVAAWAINGRSPQQAAEEILAEAAAYENGLEQLRTVRLAAKEQIRNLFAAEQFEQAELVAANAVATIQNAVAGVGNNG